MMQTTSKKNKAIQGCHAGLTEILPRVWVGRLHDIEDLAAEHGITRIYALAAISDRVWSHGWRGHVEAVPIRDQGILPRDLLARTVQDILARTRAGEQIACGCIGGHGRTGYLAAALLGVADPSLADPVSAVRERYCTHAVESQEQIDDLAEYLGRDLSAVLPSRASRGKAVGFVDWYGWDGWDFDGWQNGKNKQSVASPYRAGDAWIIHDAVLVIGRAEGVPTGRVQILSHLTEPITSTEEVGYTHLTHNWWVNPLHRYAVTEVRQGDGTIRYEGYRYAIADVQAAQ